MGKAGDWVRKCARDAVTAQLQNMALRVSQQTPFITVGCLNSDQTKVTLADGSSWNVVLSGNIAGRCGTVTRMNSNTYYMVGQNLKTFQLDGGNDGYFIAGWYPPGSTHSAGVGSVQWATSYPSLTVFNVKNQTNYWQIPQDPALGVFQPYTNPDFIPGEHGIGVSLPPPGDNATDGLFFAALKPGLGEIVIVRAGSWGKVQQNGVGNPPVLSSIDVAWTRLMGVGFNNVTNQVTWTSVQNGSTTLNFPGRVASVADLPGGCSSGLIRNIQHFEMEPFFYWKSDGTMTFDIMGDWNSSIQCITGGTALIVGFAYGIDIVNGGSISSIEGDQSIDDLVNHSIHLYFGVSPRTRFIFSNGRGGTANELTVVSSRDIFYCVPYGNPIQDRTADNLHTTTFDTLRVYDVSSLPGFGTPIANTSVDIKVTADQAFTTISTLATGSTDTVTLTNYAWDASNSLLKKGTQIAGKAIPTGTSAGQVGTIMDWIIK